VASVQPSASLCELTLWRVTTCFVTSSTVAYLNRLTNAKHAKHVTTWHRDGERKQSAIKQGVRVKVAVLETRCETIALFGCTRRKLATDMEDCTNKLSVWQEIICTLKPKGKRPPGRPRRSWEDNNKMYLQDKIGRWTGSMWFRRGTSDAWNLMATWGSVGFPSRSLLHVVSYCGLIAFLHCTQNYTV
jgi:hypothetical protein